MPHQCLQCGHAFEEGSSQILQGCPECKGTRFFYTAQAVDADERQKIAEKARKDLREVVTDMLQQAAPEAAKELQQKAGEDGWARLGPRDLRRLVRQVQEQKSQEAAAWEDKGNALQADAAAEARRRIEEQLVEEEARPDTVTIHDSGAYEIDIKGLLEHDPIVVHRDGAYMIHLPSLFGGKQ